MIIILMILKRIEKRKIRYCMNNKYEQQGEQQGVHMLYIISF